MLQEIQAKRFVHDLGKIAARIARHFGKNLIGEDEFLMALVLHYLSERKLARDQLKEKLDLLETDVNLDRVLSILVADSFIEKEDDFYNIRLATLFKGSDHEV